MGELGNMINSGSIDIRQFFTMHPFSATDHMYDHALKEIDFFRDLYIQSGKTQQRLAKICSVVNNIGMNLVVVTGYRGCGKTNFLQFLKHIAEGKIELKSLHTMCENEIKLTRGNDEDSVRQSYEEAYKGIRGMLFLDYNGTSNDYIDKTFGQYVSLHLKSRCVYINFDTGAMGNRRPLFSKLLIRFREVSAEIIKEGRIQQVISLIADFSTRNKLIIEEGFESSEYSTLRFFWRKIRNEIPKLNERDVDDFLQDNIKNLSLEQLLFSYTLLEYANIISKGEEMANNKLLYLLDNIDMISDGTTDIFSNTMMGIWKFIWDVRTVFEGIQGSQNEIDVQFVQLYNKTNFIVAMRETTAMHISEHLRDKMNAVMRHFDISSDVDKATIMQKRIDLANELLGCGEIINENFVYIINQLNALISDHILLRNLFLLYNNDYRTSMEACTWLCTNHPSKITQAIQLIQSGKKNLVFGGRGIIYRLLFDAFIDWNYLDAIGITTRRGAPRARVVRTQYGYSWARIILTILCNEQSKNPERFFVNPEESVRLGDLYAMVKDIIEIDDFVNIIDGMYSLRNKRYWNHLVTFDNILEYSPATIKGYLQNSSYDLVANNTEKKDIYIRATSAGQMFASVLCVHFEYFASRFSAANHRLPLFATLSLDPPEILPSVRRTVSDVYDAVSSCCNTLRQYNDRVLETMNKRHYREVLESPYYFEQQFHEERIIHNHISYLEAYRKYVHETKLDDNVKSKINAYIISMIKRYLDLLKYDFNAGLRANRDWFFTLNSKNLYNELNVCIEHIERETPDATFIEITRDFYKSHYPNEECTFLKNHREES